MTFLILTFIYLNPIIERNNYAPKLDHTYKSNGGKYLMFQQQQQQKHSTTTLSFKITTIHNLTYDKDHCISVWYYEDGEIPFSFDIFMILPNFVVSASRFTSAIENIKRWKLLKSDISYNPYYKADSKL